MFLRPIRSEVDDQPIRPAMFAAEQFFSITSSKVRNIQKVNFAVEGSHASNFNGVLTLRRFGVLRSELRNALPSASARAKWETVLEVAVKLTGRILDKSALGVLISQGVNLPEALGITVFEAAIEKTRAAELAPIKIETLDELPRFEDILSDLEGLKVSPDSVLHYVVPAALNQATRAAIHSIQAQYEAKFGTEFSKNRFQIHATEDQKKAVQEILKDSKGSAVLITRNVKLLEEVAYQRTNRNEKARAILKIENDLPRDVNYQSNLNLLRSDWVSLLNRYEQVFHDKGAIAGVIVSALSLIEHELNIERLVNKAIAQAA